MKKLGVLLAINLLLSTSALATNISGKYELVTSFCQDNFTGVSVINESAMNAKIGLEIDLIQTRPDAFYLVGLNAEGREIEVGAARASTLLNNVLNVRYKTKARSTNFTVVVNGESLIVSEPVTQAGDCKIGGMSVSVYRKQK